MSINKALGKFGRENPRYRIWFLLPPVLLFSHPPPLLCSSPRPSSWPSARKPHQVYSCHRDFAWNPHPHGIFMVLCSLVSAITFSWILTVYPKGSLSHLLSSVTHVMLYFFPGSCHIYIKCLCSWVGSLTCFLSPNYSISSINRNLTCFHLSVFPRYLQGTG